MHFKLKEILYPVYALAVAWLKQINLLRWTLFSSMRKEYNIKVFPNRRYKFVPYGDIAKISFSRQFLIPLKKSFEYETFEVFAKHLKPGSTVLDVGANVGLYSLFIADIIGSSGTVHAFEPSQKTFEALNKNIQLNEFSNITTSQIALSNTTTKVALATPQFAKSKYEDSFRSMDFDMDVETLPADAELIETIPLDEYMVTKNIRQVDLMKIDVEGAELLVLQGAKELLSSSNRPVLILEAAEELCVPFGNTVADTICYINQFGYHIEQYEQWQWVCVPSNKK